VGPEQEDHTVEELLFMIEHGEIEKARQSAAEFLRDGKATREFLNVAADLLDGKNLPKTGKGRPKQNIYTTKNRRIMLDFYDIRGRGLGRTKRANARDAKSSKPIKYEDAISALSEEYAMSERSIEAVVSYFSNKGKEFWAELGSREEFMARYNEDVKTTAAALRTRLPDKHYDHEIIDHYRIVRRDRKTNPDFPLDQAARSVIRSTCIHNCKSKCQKPNVLIDRRLCKDDYATKEEFLRTKFFIETVCNDEGLKLAEFLSIIESYI
jgi:hypothetical protein